jgi:hypothetical protein
MRLKSFGCSFIYGTDLADGGAGQTYATPSKLTWPALLAQRLDMPYDCYARPGMGNLAIMDYVLRQVCGNSQPNVYVVGLTYMDRVDYINTDDSRQRWRSFNIQTNDHVSAHYYRHLHSEYKDRLEILVRAKTIIDMLRHHDVPFIITAMDDLMFDQTHYNNPAITQLQDHVRPWIRDFNGKNFLDWSKCSGFEVSSTAHPLEPAHQAAADLMAPVLQHALVSSKNQTQCEIGLQ